MNNFNPLVSVIIPNYNHAIYLTQRIESVLAQSYQNFEIIILDDCSTDDSRLIIEKYRQNPHIRCIIYNEKNSGSPFKQWDKGIKLAKGDLVWIAESDDFCTPVFLSRCVDAFTGTSNCSFVFTASQLFFEDGHAFNQHFSYKKPYESIEGKKFISTLMLTGNVIWNASAVVFLKEKAFKVDGEYKQYQAAGDHLFWIQMAELGNVAIVPDVLNFFRQYVDEYSPKCSREGTTLMEEYNIFKYLVLHRHMNGFQIVKVLHCYLSEIYNSTYFANENVRDQVLKKWSIIPCFSKIIYYLCSILLRLKSLINTK